MTVERAADELDELFDRLDAPSLGQDRIQTIVGNVDLLCTDYSTADPAALADRAQHQLAEIDDLLAGRLTYSDHRDLLEQAGWLALLIAALAYDVGDADSAEQARLLALAVGADLGNSSILGWAHETDVWKALSQENWPEAIQKAGGALDLVGEDEPTGVGIQLALQQAEASGQVGNTSQMQDSLALARRLLAKHARPPNPSHHFRFDHAKFDLRQMRILLIVGRDDEAEALAIKLESEFRNPDGSSNHPMRTSEVLASRGLIEARRGNIDQAVEHATRAIEVGRRSRLSFAHITSAVADELASHSELPVVHRFLARRTELLEPRGPSS